MPIAPAAKTRKTAAKSATAAKDAKLPKTAATASRRSKARDEDRGGSAPEAERELTIAEEIDALTDPSFMTSLARGLAVIRAFSDSRRSLTIAQISQKTGIPRAAVRRCLHTLKQLGYADSDVNNFSLRPKILTLGYSYLSSTPLTVSAQPYLNNISRTLGESCSLAVLDDNEVLYVARSATSRVMSVALNTGSRLPAYCTSLGRAMLAHLPDDQLKAYFEKVKLRALTDKTVVSQRRLRDILAGVREQGYAVIDEELEVGLRSIAVPVRGASGNVLAALNVGAQAARVSLAQMEEEILPVLLRGAQELSVLLP
ncbi:helix-turn-helix domain-containing protein [Herbaspirillum sp. DW155]|uniref:IclR family transcriptional regulator domain-containing protein n=1 Tax=Herbaspirillum sp. DW155 TaxID=3095609 RepID=UPI00308B5933|nr:helix-turn-helix domain-containing protein [Herbaspirillum sp. DW155]